jgi:hypothetical protein
VQAEQPSFFSFGRATAAAGVRFLKPHALLHTLIPCPNGSTVSAAMHTGPLPIDYALLNPRNPVPDRASWLFDVGIPLVLFAANVWLWAYLPLP